MADTSIEWTEKTWNPVRGCTVVSPGCSSCYAMKQAHRFSGPGKPYEGLTEIGPKGARWNSKIRCVDEALDAPLHWKKPRRVFVNSMSDLFHEDVPDAFIDRVFAVMALAPRHTFQVLTKRADRMRAYASSRNGYCCGVWFAAHKLKPPPPPQHWYHSGRSFGWPLPNVWLGVSVENQHFADERIPLLLQTPAAVRFISAEPLLEAVDLTAIRRTRAEGFIRPLDGRFRTLDWVIVGGESGPGARPFDLAWARSIVQQCRAAGVPVFVKQFGAQPMQRDQPSSLERLHLRNRKGGDPAEWPDDLRVREFPRR